MDQKLQDAAARLAESIAGKTLGRKIDPSRPNAGFQAMVEVMPQDLVTVCKAIRSPDQKVKDTLAGAEAALVGSKADRTTGVGKTADDVAHLLEALSERGE